ncbi:hypothetical protein B1H20_29415 [Streptomyces violaceoruber]|uniref:Uncharacterized protein n=1 Tax=Streptomyces violaceoruber TaxID=1935 RepID=A0A1V0UJG7_STRVN|nr:hypothetical protein B1H20_29415 [Streptomyces violaceoruber]
MTRPRPRTGRTGRTGAGTRKGAEYGTVSVLRALVHRVTGTAAAAIGPGEGVSFRSGDGPRSFTTALASLDRRGLVVLPVPRDTPHPGARYGQGS